MPRMTKKYKQAMATVKTGRVYLVKKDHESVYKALNENHFFWNARKGVWEHKEHAPSTSMFEADDGTPTGIIRLRVMAHEADIERAIKHLKSCPGIRIVEISEKLYKNRKGSGFRIYATGVLDGDA